MKYLVSLFLLIGFYQNIYSYSYVESLDNLIDQKVVMLARSSYKVEKIVQKIKRNIKAEVSLQEIEDFLDHKSSVAFFFCDEVQFRLDDQSSIEAMQAQQSFKELQFALGVKLYLYYLEGAKQKILYKAVKNYDALNFWLNEKFSEKQSFYQKNILRCLSSAQYKERIEDNITQLQEIAKQSDYFLGLIIHSQQSLYKAENQQDFEQRLMQIVELQDKFLHVQNQTYDICDISSIIKKSIDQLSRFSVHVSARYAQCKLPSHVIRHWEGYTVTAGVACACAFIYLRYGQDILQVSEHFWNEHMQGPVNRTINVLSGYTQAPQLDTTKHKNRLEELIEAGVKKLPARGDETSLHDALVDDCNEITDGEFTRKYQIINPVIDTVAQQNEKFVEHGQEHPNETWLDKVTTYSWFDPVDKNKYQKGSRDWFDEKQPLYINWTPYYRKFVLWEDLSAPIKPQVPENQSAQSSVKQEQVLQTQEQESIAEQKSSQQAPCNTSGQFGQAAQSGKNRVRAHVPDTSTWTPEQKKEYYENQLKIIKANPYKNILRLGEPVDYKIEDESMQSKEVGNTFAKDAHMILSLTALIPLITVVGGSLFASKTLYNSVAYQPIRMLIRDLEILLNEAFYQETSFELQGRIYFLTEQLKLNIGVLTVGEQKLIDADIIALQSQDLDYAQKFNVVQRMYRTYPCLAPAKIYL